MPALLNAGDVRDALDALTDWSGDPSAISRTVEAPSFPAAISLVVRVADLAEERDHHPDIDIRWRTVKFVLSTHSEGGVTALDIDVARSIDALVAAL